MPKSATELMQEIMVSAVLDALGAFKSASGGVPNVMLRDLQAVHPNTTFDDLPKDVQTAVQASVRGAFNRLLRDGYAIMPSAGQRPPIAPPRPPRGDGPPRPRGGGPKPTVEIKPRPRSGRSR